MSRRNLSFIYRDLGKKGRVTAVEPPQNPQNPIGIVISGGNPHLQIRPPPTLAFGRILPARPPLRIVRLVLLPSRPCAESSGPFSPLNPPGRPPSPACPLYVSSLGRILRAVLPSPWPFHPSRAPFPWTGNSSPKRAKRARPLIITMFWEGKVHFIGQRT